MKWRKILKLMVVFVVSVVMVGEVNIVSADTKEELTSFSVSDADEGDTRQSTITLRRNGKIQFSFGSETYGDITITVSNSNGPKVYSKTFSAIFNGATYSTDQLAVGDYVVTVRADSYATDFDATIYAIYIPDSYYPEFDTDAKSFTMIKGKSEKLGIYCAPDGVNYTVKWSSDDSSIASVSQEGKVKAKKKGTTTIYADISIAIDTEYETLQWEIIVKNPNPSFYKVSKKMKGFKQKKTKYELIKKNKKAILYGGANTLSWDKHINSQGFVHIGVFYPYVQLTKKNGKTSVSLNLKCDVTLLSVDRDDAVDFDTVVFKSGNTSVYFNYSHSKETSKVKNGVATIENKAFVNLSSDKNTNLTKLNKLLKVLKKKKVIFKAYDSTDEGYVYYTLNAKTKRNWAKLAKNYKKLIEMY